MQYSEYDDVTAIAAFQAMSIYLLLRLKETNDEATNFDLPMIYTLWVCKTGDCCLLECSLTESTNRVLLSKQVNRLLDMGRFPMVVYPRGKIGFWQSR